MIMNLKTKFLMGWEHYLVLSMIMLDIGIRYMIYLMSKRCLMLLIILGKIMQLYSNIEPAVCIIEPEGILIQDFLEIQKQTF